ncbi:MAG: MlaD family protein [Verrucomicrobia bacterium]|nr:MlaD family protein [Verrucomicrobiota bacterium]
MTNQQKGLEIKVGLFVFIGLIIIAFMAIQFGRVGQGLSEFYLLTVKFPNASGIIKNAEVHLAGAKVGVVAEDPQAVSGQIGYVSVKMKIRSDIKLPVGSYFQIDSSGMMGEKFVEITPADGFKYDSSNPADERKLFDPANPKMVIAPETKLEGYQMPGLSDLTSKGDENMKKLAATLDELKETLQKIQSGVLNDENIGNLKESFASIKTSTDNIAKASSKIDGIVSGAQSAVDSAKETFSEAKQTMTAINGATADVRSVIASSQTVLKAAQSGQGTVPMLLGNREVADNLRAVIANVRKHGLLFYRDSAPASTPVAADARAKPKN